MNVVVTDIVEKKLPLKVNYGSSMKRMIRAGRYVYADPHINPLNFPTRREGRVKLEAVLVNFGRYMLGEEVVAEFDKMGLRTGEAYELLTLGIQHPDEQKIAPVVALGTFWKIDYDRYSLCLYYDMGGRKVRLSKFGDYWGDLCRFLAFRRF